MEVVFDFFVCASSNHFEMLTLEMLELEIVGQRHWPNTRIYKTHASHFELALTVSKSLAFEIFDLKKVGQGHEI